MSKIHNIPLLLLVFLSATAAMLCWIFGLSALSSPLMLGDVFVSKSIAGLAKDALFVPLKPLMYALIILSIGSSLAISTGGLGAKFIRVFSFFICFSLIGMAVGIGAFILFSGLDIGLALPKEGNGSGLIKEMPFLLKAREFQIQFLYWMRFENKVVLFYLRLNLLLIIPMPP